MDQIPPTPVAPSQPVRARHSILLIFVAVLVLIGIIAAAYYAYTSMYDRTAEISGTPYFTYTDEELKALPSLRTQSRVQSDELFLWDEKAFQLISEHQLPDTAASRIYAYLTAAQRDAALLAGGHGNVSSISREVLCTFFPGDCDELKREIEAGIFPEETAFGPEIATLIMGKVQVRMAEEDASTRSYPRLEGDEYWNHDLPWVGYETAKWTPWYLETHNQFRVPELPLTDDQLEKTKSALSVITDEQKLKTIFWAGGPGTKTPPGQWLSIADDYLKAEEAPVAKVLDVRAHTAAACADAVLAVFDSKYTYWHKRPYMLDATIETIMPTPAHPSYAAGHSTISAAAGTVLTHYFPSRTDEIAELVEDAGLSRVWGGIHFPVDHEQGLLLGTSVGNNVITKAQSK